MDGRFCGQCYTYPTPNNGEQTIGVTEVLGGLFAVCWVTDSGAKRRIKSSQLPVLASLDAVQRNLDAWAVARKLREVA
jgi:hypothetical protein